MEGAEVYSSGSALSSSAQSQTEEQVQHSRSALRTIVTIVLGLVCLPLTIWAAAALYIDCRMEVLRGPAPLFYLSAVGCFWIFFKSRLFAAVLTVCAFGLVLGWWLSLKPSNHRDWQSDVATLSYADIDGSKIKLHNIRNCDYRTEKDFDVRYYEKALDLENLRSADLFMVYWGSPLMAHTMVSFGFDGGDYVCFSIETRKQKNQTYSAIKGLFRQFELIYVVADERDLVRLRTNYRQGEDVYLYRLRASKEALRSSFVDYVRRLNSLRVRPQWYNALTDNCTTSIRAQRAAAERAPWDWRMLVNGFGNELLYERGLIDTNIPLKELTRRAHINERARAADQAADFSARIRQGVPGAEHKGP